MYIAEIDLVAFSGNYQDTASAKSLQYPLCLVHGARGKVSQLAKRKFTKFNRAQRLCLKGQWERLIISMYTILFKTANCTSFRKSSIYKSDHSVIQTESRRVDEVKRLKSKKEVAEMFSGT